MTADPNAPDNPGDRVVLGRRTSWGIVDLQWTGKEPDALDDPGIALELGASWEGDELVTHNLAALSRDFSQRQNQYLEDSD